MTEEVQIQSNELMYRGVIGSIHSMKLSEDSRIYFGKLLNIDKGTLAIYDGDTIEELKKDFKECVESYLRTIESEDTND